MIVTPDILRFTLAGLNLKFEDAYAKAQEDARWKLIADDIETTLPIQDYGWLGRGAVMEEFKDRVREQEINQFTYTLADKVYKAAEKIKRTTLEDDQYGVLNRLMAKLGGEAVRHWNELAYKGLTLGFSTLCYDGQNFFSASHQEGNSPTQSNVTAATLSDASLEAAEAAMMAYQDDKGVPMEITPTALVVGPKLARRASDLLGSNVRVINVGDGTAGAGATAATNINNYFAGKYTLIVNHYIYNANAFNWFLLDLSKSVKPIVIQSRSDVPITTESDMADGSSQIKEEYVYTVRGRYVQGYGLWQTGFGSTATN